mmetsp:Transcript_11844/g.21919  ORF Transcript_11844/g.21919 Transcript_11844/m.21919 type:complete len:98 (-) Transcript_11844:469-762(-)
MQKLKPSLSKRSTDVNTSNIYERTLTSEPNVEGNECLRFILEAIQGFVGHIVFVTADLKQYLLSPFKDTLEIGLDFFLFVDSVFVVLNLIGDDTFAE